MYLWRLPMNIVNDKAAVLTTSHVPNPRLHQAHEIIQWFSDARNNFDVSSLPCTVHISPSMNTLPVVCLVHNKHYTAQLIFNYEEIKNVFWRHSQNPE